MIKHKVLGHSVILKERYTTLHELNISEYKEWRSDNVVLLKNHGDPLVCETPKFTQFIDNQLREGGKIISLTRRQAAHRLQEYSRYSFLLEAESNPKPSCGWRYKFNWKYPYAYRELNPRLSDL
jgi:hypothetical protein